jgi:hypothetical protein
MRKNRNDNELPEATRQWGWKYNAGRDSPNKRKILLKTLEQLALASFDTYFCY